MRQLLLLTAIACFCSVFCIAKVNDKLSHKIVKQKAPADSKPYSGQSNKKTQIKIYKANNLSAPVGEIIGTTTYDLQTNHSVCRRIAAHPNGSWFYAGWTMGKDFSTGASNRGTGFNLYDNQTGTWLSQPDFRIEPSTRVGWPTIGFNQGRQFSITHSGSQGMLFTWREGNGNENNWNEVYVGDLVNDTGGIWARAVTEGSNIYTIIGRPFDSEPFGGLNGGLNFIRSLDNGNTWESLGGLEENYSNSIPVNMWADGYAIDAANGIVSVVYGAGLSEIILYKSQDQGENWEKKIIQKSSNPLVENLDPLDNDGNGNFTVEPFFGSNGGNTVIIDSNGKSHVVYSGLLVYNMSTYNFLDDFSYFNDDRACALFYWNEDLENPEIIGKSVMNDANADGKLGSNFLLLKNDRQPYYSGFICQPQLGIDAGDNLYVSYTAHVDGDYVPEEVSFLSSEYGGGEVLTYTQSFNEDSNLYTDVFMIKSMDGGSNWQGPLNVTKASDSEEVYASIPRNIGDTIMLIYQHDLLPGTFSQAPQVLATINEIAAVKILPEDINDSVAPPDSEPYFTAPNLSLEGTQFFIPQGCSLLNEEYLDAFAFGMDYPDGIIKEFQLAGSADYDTPGSYTKGIFVQDSQGNISDTMYYNIEVLPDTEAPIIELDLTCSVNIPLGGEIDLPIPSITDYFIFEGTLDETDCDVSENLDISHNIDVETEGTYTVIYNISDFAGNSSSLEIAVNVVGESDTEGPVINVTNIPDEININQLSLINDIEINALDNIDCSDVNITVEGLTEILNATSAGTYTISISATDQSNNTTTESYSIKIIDICENVVVLDLSPTDNCNYTEFDFSTATPSSISICDVESPDTIFKFIVPDNGQVLIRANLINAAFHTSCTEEELFCESIFSSELIGNLPPNDTIFLRLTPYWNDIYNEVRLCISEANEASNNTCENATTASVGNENDCLIGNTIITDVTFNSLNVEPECQQSFSYDFDVYYEFTAPQSGYVKIISEEDLLISVYDTCNGNLVACGLQESNVTPYLNPSETYILQVFGRFSGDFDLCLFEVEPQLNNTCENAIFVDVATDDNCDSVSFEFNNTNNSLNTNSTCSEPDLNDAFYKFVVPPSGYIAFSGEFYNARVALFNSCAGESFFCDGLSRNTGLKNLTPRDTIIVQFLYSDNRVYNTCILEVSPSPNDNCENATELTIGSQEECLVNQVTYTTLFNEELDGIFDDCYFFNKDVFYTYITPPSGYVKIESNIDVRAELLSDCNGEITECLAYIYDNILPYSEPGTENLLRVEASTDTIELCVFEVQPTFNNVCGNAELIYPTPLNSCEGALVTADLSNNNSEIIPPCTSYRPPLKDLFYKFIVPEGGQIEIDFNANFQFAIYDNCAGNALACELRSSGERISGLPVGDTLILQLFPLNELVVDFCIIAIPPSTNNTCESPINLPVFSDEDCSTNQIIQYVNNNTLNKERSCFGFVDRDAFFEFTAPQTGSVKVNSNSDFLLYENCEDTYPSCHTQGDILPDLIAGNNYILQSVIDYGQDTLKICLSTIQTSENNDCENPLVIFSPLGDCMNIEEVDLSQNSLNAIPECSSNLQADAFFVFVAPPSGQVILNISNRDTGVAIYDSCNGESIFCNSSDIDERIVRNLVPATEYILQTFQREIQVFDLCIQEAPASVNNLCENAILLEVQETCEAINEGNYFDITYNSLEKEPACDSAYGDAYFEFIAPENGYVEIDIYSDFFSYGFALYNACNGNLINCSDDFRSTVVNTNLPGSLIILQIFDTNSSFYETGFSICLKEVAPSENDLCENALPTTLAEPGNCEMTKIPVQIEGNALDFENGCSSNSLADVFYYFVAPPSGSVKIMVEGNAADFALFENCNGYSIECGNNEVIKGLNVGETYYLQLFSSYLSVIAFCIEEIVSTENNFCEGAITLEIGEESNCTLNTVSQNISNNSVVEVCDNTYQASVFYKFTVPPSGNFKVLLNNSYADGAFYEGCGNENILCIEDIEGKIIDDFTIGETFYLQLLAYNIDELEICMVEVNQSSNTNCEDAIWIDAEELYNCNLNTLDLSSNTLQNNYNCYSSRENADAYYKFVVPPSGRIRLYTTEDDIGFALTENCGDELLACRYRRNEHFVNDLNPNDTLILQLSTNNTYTNGIIGFCIEEIKETSNDTCEGAITLNVGNRDDCLLNEVEIITTYNSAAFAATCGEGIDAFYEFTVPQSGHVKLISNATFGVSIYPACNISEVYCLTYAHNSVLPFLNPGETYILRLFKLSIVDSNFDLLDICLVEVTPDQYDNCESPLLIDVVIENENCEGNLIQVSMENNPLDLAGVKGSPFNSYYSSTCNREANADAIFKFVVPSSGQIKINVSNENIGAALYESCTNAYIECKRDEIENHVFKNLTAGDTIILQLFQTQGENFEFCIQDAPPTVNNACENAFLIDLTTQEVCLSDSIIYSFDASGNTVNIDNCTRSNYQGDLFFQFVAPESGAIEVNQTAFGIYTSCEEEPFYCAFWDDERVTNLTPGETYLLQLFDFGFGNNINLCVNKVIPSDNNTCKSATLISLDNCYDINLVNNTLDVDADCDFNEAYDAFYQLVVPPSGQIEYEFSRSSMGLAMSYDCTGTQFFCNDNMSRFGILENLQPNSTIILQIFDESNNNSTICFNSAPPSINNSCENAIQLAVNEGPKSCLTNALSINGTYNTNNIPTDCTEFKDAFYTFTFPDTGYVQLTSYRSFSVALFDACEGDLIWCRPINSDGYTIGGLTANENYVLQVFDFSDYDFHLCLTHVYPSANDNCANAIIADVRQQNNCNTDVYVEAVASGNTLELQPTCNLNPIFADIYYKFTVPPSGQVKIFTEFSNVGIAIFDACSGNNLYCNEFTSDDVIKGLTPNDELILQFFIRYTGNFNFCIEESVPLINNNCDNAIFVQAIETGVCPLYTTYASLENNILNIEPECSENASVDVFYKTVVPQNGELIIYTSGSIGFAAYATCSESSIECSRSINSYKLKNLIPSDTIILQFFKENGSYLSFCLEETDTPAYYALTDNNNCRDDLLPLYVNEAYSCDSIYQICLNDNDLTDITACSIEAEADAFYTITVPSSGRILFETYRIFGGEEISVELLNDCNTVIACLKNFRSEILEDLPPDENLILRVLGRKADFNLCLQDAAISENNTCENAQFILVDSNDGLPDKITANIQNNILSLFNECNSNAEADIFYKFIVPESGQILYEDNTRAFVSIYSSCNEYPLYCLDDDVDEPSVFDFPPGDTLILHLSISYRSNFEFSLVEFESAINNSCDKAYPINIVQPGECLNNLIELTNENLILSLQPPCASNVSYDAYYSLSLPQATTFEIITTNSNFGYAFYNGCNGQLLTCNEEFIGGVFGFPSIDELILQVFSRYTTFIQFCLVEHNNSYVKNSCQENNELLSVYNQCINNFTVGNLITASKFSYSCSSIWDEDVFYDFVVPPSGNIKVVSYHSLGLGIHSNAPCSDEPLFCDERGMNRNIFGLPVGDTLKLEIFGYENQFYSFCIEEVDIEDNNKPTTNVNGCQQATHVELIESGTCEEYPIQIDGSDYTLFKDPECAPAILDAYYQLTIPENSQLRFITSNGNIKIAIYDTCTGETLFCQDENYGGFRNLIKELPPSAEVLVQIFSNEIRSTEICFEEAPKSENNYCDNAIPIVLNDIWCVDTIQLNNYNNDATIIPSCGENNADAFYSFQVPNSGAIVIESNQSTDVSLLTACEGTEIYCGGGDYLHITDLPVGENIIVQFHQRSPYSIIEFCITNSITTLNDSCENAISVEVGNSKNCDEQYTPVTLVNNSLDGEANCYAGCADAFYTFVVPNSGNVTISTFDREGSTVVGSIYQSCESNLLYCNTFSSRPIENLPAGETVVLQLYQEEPGRFNFCINDAPKSSNNTCNNAEFVEVVQPEMCNGNFTLALNYYNDLDKEAPCFSNRSADIFYSFIVPPSGKLKIVNGGFSITLYEDCNSDPIFCGSLSDDYFLENLPPGDTLILQILEEYGTDFSFCLQEPQPTVNNGCAQALTIDARSIVDCEDNFHYVFNSLNTATAPQSSCYESEADIFYQILVPPSKAIEFSIEIDNFNFPNLTIYDNCNGNEIYCGSAGEHFNLPDTVIIKLSHLYPEDFEMCIKALPAPSCQALIGGNLMANKDCDVSRVEIIIKNENSDTLETLTVDEEGNYLTTNEYTCGNYTAQLNESSLPDCFISDSNPVNFIVNDDDILDGVEFVSISCAGDFSLVKSPYQICQGELLSGIKIGLGKYNFYADDNGEIGAYLSTCDNAGIICSTNEFNFDTNLSGEHIIWVTEEKTDENGEACESEPESLNFEIKQTAEAKLMLNSTNTSSANPMNLMSFVEDNKTGYWSGPGIFSFPDLDGNVSWIFSGTALQALSPVTLYYTVSNGNCENSYALIVHIEEGKIRNPVLTNPVLSGIDSVTLNETKSRLQIADSWSNEIQKQAGVDKGLLIYPNPSNGIFKIDCLECSTFPSQAFIYNLNGALVENIQYKIERKSFNEAIDIRNELPGVYIVKFYYENDDFEYLKLIKH